MEMSRVVTSGEKGGGGRLFFFLALAMAVRTQNPNH